MEEFTQLVLHNLRAVTPLSFPLYAGILDHAFAVAPPPFSREWFGRRYFELARDTEWFANSLVANSALEGYGSTQIWKFSNKMDNDDYVEAVRQHSLDESRHSTMFISMFNLIFPGVDLDEKARTRMHEQQPRYSRSNLPAEVRLPEAQRMSEADTFNELVGVHITEIRALVLQFLLQPVVQVYAPEASRQRLAMFSTSLIRDEAKHIAYTAKIFEQAAAAGHAEQLADLFETRVRDFNDLTMVELEREKKVAI